MAKGDTGRPPCLRLAEWRVLARLARGEDDAAIAVALTLTTRTVRRHLARIYRVLPVGDAGNQRVAAAVWYERRRVAPGDRSRAASPALRAAEWLVLERVARGESNKQIAAALVLVPQTVKNHLGGVYARLPLGAVANRRVASALWYLRAGRGQHEEAERG